MRLNIMHCFMKHYKRRSVSDYEPECLSFHADHAAS